MVWPNSDMPHNFSWTHFSISEMAKRTAMAAVKIPPIVLDISKWLT